MTASYSASRARPRTAINTSNTEVHCTKPRNVKTSKWPFSLLRTLSAPESHQHLKEVTKAVSVPDRFLPDRKAPSPGNRCTTRLQRGAQEGCQAPRGAGHAELRLPCSSHQCALLLSGSIKCSHAEGKLDLGNCFILQSTTLLASMSDQVTQMEEAICCHHAEMLLKDTLKGVAAFLALRQAAQLSVNRASGGNKFV